ncbi:MAG: SMP-30/gluconolactonase/LRE family protein [Gammaproteobacteria bacterium]|nr:SMP-30/gluconolactonase/LRE family protein [Gammaproteobacteria bacterium]
MKKQFFFQLFLTIITLIFQTQGFAHGERLEKQWETDGFSNPESVVYDKQANVLYVSNVNGAANEKDGNGFISKVSLDGKILAKEWVTGLNAPKGLAIHGNKLYTADIDTLVEIDIPTAVITKSYQVTDAKFLNDVAASSSGEIFVSDMMANRILCLKDGMLDIWLESPELESPNGLLVQGDNMILGTWGVMIEGFKTDTPGHLKTISLKDKSIQSIGDGSPVGNLDGVEADLDGDYYVTDWMAGKLLHIEKSGEAGELLVLEQGMADHEFIPEMDLIILPMMNTNKLLAYKAHEYEDDEAEEED